MLSFGARNFVTQRAIFALGSTSLKAAVVSPGIQRIRFHSTSTPTSSANPETPNKAVDYSKATAEFIPAKSENSEAKAMALATQTADTPHFRRDLAHRHPLTTGTQQHAWDLPASPGPFSSYALPHPVWDEKAANSVEITHHKPQNFTEHLAFKAVTAMRFSFDVLSGYKFGRLDERGWLNRIVFLETVAGVPGMVGAMVRHLNSLRKMQRDYGWIHTLLEEAENERMHLMTALVLRKPGPFFRLGVLLTQGFFLAAYSITYMISPRFCHRFVGYLEEEAVITYTKLLKELDEGHLPLFAHMPAPPVAVDYWQLDKNAKLREVWMAIRTDESHHRDVNHTFASMNKDDPNPFPPGH